MEALEQLQGHGRVRCTFSKEIATMNRSTHATQLARRAAINKSVDFAAIASDRSVAFVSARGACTQKDRDGIDVDRAIGLTRMSSNSLAAS
jgi:hypothetical protein